jgi:hypothetical protein
MGIGLGILYAATNFPVLAPLKPSQQPHAVRLPLSLSLSSLSFPPDPDPLHLFPKMAFYGFTRAFGQVFGIAIGSTILQNELTKKLPAEFIAASGGASDIAFAAIPIISTLYVSSPVRLSPIH